MDAYLADAVLRLRSCPMKSNLGLERTAFLQAELLHRSSPQCDGRQKMSSNELVEGVATRSKVS